ncbi:DUF4199 domain-containing protein [Rhizorhabdus dicambivorans]|uniref:DUF4199 domain-containing protein n=1 Tax=Rhizorhabdus dicambivorans TaxID=1850238 RepID=A0A2A4G039_9SPHN|nr:DUF4199 domain-containing protein [Rhizorhabdus dicambivorans]ATE63176.1 DUF4199 domain-containing protein [Rhizorhabdus dicambivorans]PCE43353.1 DUF4199 domain-containing protein [Rhizorhabdus dicambivorans]
MFRTILTYGTIAGLIVGIPNIVLMLASGDGQQLHSVTLGYLIMLVALSAVFVAVKRRRDGALGGAIGFWPALGLGLAISLIATLFYIAAWELVFAIKGTAFLQSYTDAMVAEAAAKGASAAEQARIRMHWNGFWAEYRNPLVRIPYTVSEILPVGLLVSLVSAGLLRNPRFLPARGADRS